MNTRYEHLRQRLSEIDWWKAVLWVGFIAVLIVAINSQRQVQKLERRVHTTEQTVKQRVVKPVQVVVRGRGKTGTQGPRGLPGLKGERGRTGNRIVVRHRHTRTVRVVERARPGPAGPRGPRGAQGAPGLAPPLAPAVDQLEQQVLTLQQQLNQLIAQLPPGLPR